MTGAAEISWLPDGRRMHLHHGPIDLILEIFGTGRAVAYRAAVLRFQTVLQELVEELPKLKKPATPNTQLNGSIARNMQNAVEVHLPEFVTPMAAVAGAVADEIAKVISKVPDVTKAYVNNGGDVALVMNEAEVMVTDIGGGIARATIHGSGCVRGVATSGWRGRSLSLGIADAVTVLGSTAALADVAATLIGNEVDLPDHTGIVREMAHSQQIDSDLDCKLVTVEVPVLGREEIATALERGTRFAQTLGVKEGVWGGILVLQGHVSSFGDPSLAQCVSRGQSTLI